MGAAVAKRPKKNSGKEPEAVPQEVEGGDEKYTSMARLRPEFQQRLARVARDAGLKVGELIETHLAEMVNREYRRIVMEEAEKLKNE